MSTPRRVLVVEDDREIAALVELHLKDSGYDVRLAHDGRTGLAKALEERYSLIILDLMLAEHLVHEKILMRDGKVDHEVLEDVFHMLMVINPTIELYLLDPQGEILAYSAPPGNVKRKSAANGHLSHLDDFPRGGNGTGGGLAIRVLHHDGHRLFAVNASSNSLSVFTVGFTAHK